MDLNTDLATNFGVFTTADARSWGMDGKAVARHVRSGEWHRIRRGAFVPGAMWKEADVERRHLVRAAAIHRSYSDRVVFSHATASLVHGMSVWGVDLGRVHVTRRDAGAGRTERDIVHHEGFPDPAETWSVGPWLVVDPVRAAFEMGTTTSAESALVTVDHCLNLGLATPEDFAERYDLWQHWPGSQHMQVVLRLASPLSQSVGESRCRYAFWRGGLPTPELQYAVRDEDGEIAGISDFAWPDRGVLGEFDGRSKYGRLLKPGQKPEDAVFAEKVREDNLRRLTGFRVIRFTWPDLADPSRMCRRLSQMLREAA